MLRVTAASPAHAELIAALHAATIHAGEGEWSADWVARLLALPGVFAIVAEREGPIGFALCMPAGEAVDIAAIGVVAEARRGGVGRALLAECERRARSAGAARIMLEVADDNTAALAFYRASGFTQAGRRPRYYARAGLARDAVLLTKSL